MAFPFSSNTSTDSDSDVQILNTLNPREDDGVVCRRLLKMFSVAVTHPVWREWRQEASKCYRYYEDDQWTAAELKELEERGQPPTVRNEIKPIVSRVHGQFIQTRQTTTFLGRNPQDEQTANVYADLHRFVDQRNSYEFHESEIVADGLKGGIGWLEMDVRDNELGEKEIYEQPENPFDIFPDPYFRRLDLSDCKYIARAKWIDLEDGIALWPKKEQELRACMNGHGYQVDADNSVDPAVRNDVYGFLDADRERIRPVEIWYRRKVRLFKVFTPNGSIPITAPLDLAAIADLKKTLPKNSFVSEPMVVSQMWVGVFCAGLLIHHAKSPRQHHRFPWLPFICDRTKSGKPRGLVYPLIPIQDAINKRESKALNMLSNRRIIAEENAIKDPDLAQIENGKADGFVEVAPQALSGGKVQFPDNVDIGQAQLAMLQEAKGAMPRVSGISDESLGMRTEVRSGAGIARKQQMTNLIVNPVVMHLRQFRYLKASLLCELIKEVFDAPMTFQVTDDPNAARLVEVTQNQLQYIKERIYDIVIDDEADYATVREQQLDMLFKLWPSIAQLGPGMMKVAVSMTTLRDKDGILKMLDAAMQAQPEKPKMSIAMTWNELSDEEKAFFAMSSLQSPELAQFLAQRAGDPAFKQKIDADLAKTQVKEGLRAEVERGKLDTHAMSVAADGMLQVQKIRAEAQQALQDRQAEQQAQAAQGEV